MIKKVLIYLITVSLLFITRPDILRAGNYYLALPVPNFYSGKIQPDKVFETTLAILDKKDDEPPAPTESGLDKIQIYLEPILETISATFKTDLKPDWIEAVANKNKKNIKPVLLKIIFYDMKNIFETILNSRSEPPATLKVLLSLAYRDYLFLSPEVAEKIVSAASGPDNDKEEKGVMIDGEIKKLFRNAYLALGAESPYTNTQPSPPDLELFVKYTGAIEKKCLSVFPNFKPTQKTKKAKEEKKIAEEEKK
ncbi:MAG: hypothetical protein AAB019_01470 [Planctomycetota bacterium]